MSHSRLVSYISGALLLVALLLAVPAARAQDGPNYTLNWWTVDDGGATSGGAGGYTLGSTIGQPDAAVWAGGGYTLSGGFWVDMMTSAEGGRIYLPLILHN